MRIAALALIAACGSAEPPLYCSVDDSGGRRSYLCYETRHDCEYPSGAKCVSSGPPQWYCNNAFYRGTDERATMPACWPTQAMCEAWQAPKDDTREIETRPCTRAAEVYCHDLTCFREKAHCEKLNELGPHVPGDAGCTVRRSAVVP